MSLWGCQDVRHRVDLTGLDDLKQTAIEEWWLIEATGMAVAVNALCEGALAWYLPEREPEGGPAWYVVLSTVSTDVKNAQNTMTFISAVS